MERIATSMTISIFMILLCCFLGTAEQDSVHWKNPQQLESSSNAVAEKFSNDSEAAVERLFETARDLSSITKLFTNYIASYASSAAAWIKYPYFGVSTGVATIMVLCVIVYILILVSGAVVVNGREGSARHGGQDLQREQLTHAIMKAIDHAANKFAENQSLGYESNRTSESNYVWDRAAGMFKHRSRRSAEGKGRQSIEAYVSSSVYNVLTWLSKPFMGYFVVLAAIVLYMVVIVQIAMTSNVFPLASLGRSLSGSLAPIIRSHLNDELLVQTAEHVMKAINDWQVRNWDDEQKIE